MVKNLRDDEFRRLTGIKTKTFEHMIEILKEAESEKMQFGGKPHKCCIEDRLLMTLEYLREYRTYFHIGQSFGVSETTCLRTCRWIEDVLIKSKKFSLPGKKFLLENDGECEIILIDATETPISRPKKTL